MKFSCDEAKMYILVLLTVLHSHGLGKRPYMTEKLLTGT